MNKSMLIIMGGALALAVIVALLVSSRLTSKQVSAPTKFTVEVLVANKILFTGQKIEAGDTTWQLWSDKALYKGIIKKSDQPDPNKLTIYGSPLRRNIESGEPITTQAVITDAKNSFLSALLAPGMRAATIGVRENSSAGGFVAPGDHVDVILTYTARFTSPETQSIAPKLVQKFATQLILSNVKVLAVDQNAKTDSHAVKVARTVTLEVDLRGAQKLIVAQQMGDLAIILRRLGEKDDPNAEPPMVTDLDNSDLIKKITELADQSKNNQPVTYVRMYNGSSVQNVPVRAAADGKK